MSHTSFTVPKPKVVGPPGSKAKSEDAKLEFLSLKEYVVGQISDMIMSLIPDSIKELPPEYVMRVGSVALLAMAAMFVYFTADGTMVNLKSKYISLEADAGNCQVVSKEITGQGPFYGTSQGAWMGDPDFRYNYVEYLLTLNKFQADMKDYTTMVCMYLPILFYTNFRRICYTFSFSSCTL